MKISFPADGVTQESDRESVLEQVDGRVEDAICVLSAIIDNKVIPHVPRSLCRPVGIFSVLFRVIHIQNFLQMYRMPHAQSWNKEVRLAQSVISHGLEDSPARSCGFETRQHTEMQL